MVLALLVFLLVSGAVVGAYMAVTKLPGILASRRLDQRLRDVSMDATPSAAASDGGAAPSIVRRVTEGPLPAIDRVLAGTLAGSRLARLIDRSGVNTTPSAMLLIALAAVALGGGITFVFSKNPLAAAVVGALFGIAPFAWLKHRGGARLKRFEEQFPEALDLMSRAIRAGHAFQTALGMAGDELPPPVGPEFKRTFEQQNYGLPLRDALNELADRIDHLDVRFFVTAVLIQRETGGNLSEILDNLASVVRERFKIRRQIRVHTAHGRFTGFVLLALPAALCVALYFINPEHMQLLFHEHMGQMMLVAALVLQTIGFFWIRQVIKIEV